MAPRSGNPLNHRTIRRNMMTFASNPQFERFHLSFKIPQGILVTNKPIQRDRAPHSSFHSTDLKVVGGCMWQRWEEIQVNYNYKDNAS